MNPGKDFIGVGLGAIILNEKGEVLLMKRGKNSKNEVGTWALIGGMLDFGETLQQGIIREVLEETGLAVEIEEQFPAHDHLLPNENQHWVGNVFVTRLVSGIPTIIEPEKCEELSWFSIDNLPTPIAKMSKYPIEYFSKTRK
jgi:8-oxo-dGTP diphosphatase